MAEKHATVSNSSATWQFFLQKLWNFVENTQSGIVQFVQEGGDYAVKSGGSFWNGSDDISGGFGTDNDYIVIEPVNAYPGGDKWQMKFVSSDVSDDELTECSVEVSWLGGYDTSANDFPAANQTTGAQNSWSYVKATVSDTWYFSCSNSDTYQNSSGTQTYTYFRVLLYDATASEDGKFMGTYCGGYIPVEPDNDTKPVVWLAKLLKAAAGATNNTWGDIDGTDSGLSPGNYAHNTSGGNISAFIGGVSNIYTGYGNTRSGNWANGPTLIQDYNNNIVLGAFGTYTQMAGHLSRADGATNSTATYKIAADQVIRWNPD